MPKSERSPKFEVRKTRCHLKGRFGTPASGCFRNNRRNRMMDYTAPRIPSPCAAADLDPQVARWTPWPFCLHGKTAALLSRQSRLARFNSTLGFDAKRWRVPYQGRLTVRNANGVLKQSPRLAHSAYLGSKVRTRCQPQRGCVSSPRSSSCGRSQMTNNDPHVRESSRNPVGVAVVLACEPNVVPQSRDNVGLWDGAPLGLVNVQTRPRGQGCPRSGCRGS